jgi:GNAT superfamily N-acetyltransferase
VFAQAAIVIGIRREGVFTRWSPDDRGGEPRCSGFSRCEQDRNFVFFRPFEYTKRRDFVKDLSIVFLIITPWAWIPWILFPMYYPDMNNEKAFCAKWSFTDRLYVATSEDGTPIAACAFLRRDEKMCELGRVATAAEHQGRGVASFLLKKVMEEIASLGYEKIFLQTSHAQVGARRLYEAKGFKCVHSEVRGFGLYTVFDYEYDLTQKET